VCEIEIERKDTSSLFDIISIDSFCNLTTGRAKICLNTLCVCVFVCSRAPTSFQHHEEKQTYPTIFSGPNARNADDVNAIPSPIEKKANLPFDQG
jgi:hypothetical protein